MIAMKMEMANQDEIESFEKKSDNSFVLGSHLFKSEESSGDHIVKGENDQFTASPNSV